MSRYKESKMKVLVDIPDSEFHMFKDATSSGIGNSAMKHIMNGTIISDNLTNGDIIRIMFPNMAISNELRDVMTIYTMCSDGNEFVTHFDLDWWKAPYCAEREGGHDQN